MADPERRRQLLLILIMTLVGLAIGGTTIVILYETALSQTGQRLRDTVQSHARLMEAMVHYRVRTLETIQDPNKYQQILDEILDQVAEAQQHFTGLGETGEFVLGRREGDWIIFLLHRSHDTTQKIKPIHYTAIYAEPMRKAVTGQSGLLIGLDYRGKWVMAAHEPVAPLDIGIVAKIDLAELRYPFILAGSIALGAGFLLILMGTAFFFRVSEPLLKQAQENVLLRENKKYLEETQNALQEKSTYLDNILSSAIDMAIVATDAELKIKYCNSTAENFLRFKANTVIGRSIFEIHQERNIDHKHLEKAINGVLTHGEYHHEFRHLFGTETILDSRLSAIVDSNGKRVGFFLMAHDVTVRRKTQDALIRSERKYRLLVESANDAILVADAKTGLILEANRMAEKLLKRKIETIIGLHQTLLHPPEEAAYYQSLFQQHVEGRGNTLDDIVVVRSDGSQVPVEIRAAVTDIEDRKVILGIFRDISERKNAEEALRISQQDLAKAQRIAHLGNWRLDLETHCFRCSEELYHIFGYDSQKSEISFEDFLKPIHPEDKLFVENTIHKILSDCYPSYDIEHRIIRTDGVEIYVHHQGEWFHEEKEKSVCLIGTIQDITAQKNMELHLKNLNQELEDRVLQRTKELERSNWDLQQFAYVASHDLKEPLRLVAGFVQLLEKRYSGVLDEKATQYISYVVDGVKHMEALIDSLLSYARLESEGEPMTYVDTNTVLNRTLLYVGSSIRETNAIITQDPLPIVMGNSGQSIQVFQNLLGNAIKFHSDKPPEIHVSCHLTEEGYLFSVKDNGIGIDAQYADRIFVIFQKLHARSRYKGTGIGLALCKRIIDRHGGRIWMESIPNQGSTFFFTLPNRIKNN